MEIAAWREREARSRDVPRGRILKDDVVADIAVQAPTSMERLSNLRSLPKGFERSKWGQEIPELVRKAILFAAEREDQSVTEQHLDDALHELVVAGGDLTRSLLGAGGRPDA